MTLRLCALLLLLCHSALLAEEAANKPLRILTVGNSFAYNATKYLPKLAAAVGKKVIIRSANYTACSLERHWKTLKAAQAGKSEGFIYPSEKKGGPRRSLPDFLAAGPWDFITIQQTSFLSDKAETYRPWGPNLITWLKQQAPEAEIIVHQTWAYRPDDPRFKKGYTPQAMHLALSSAYRSLAKEFDLRIVPVGEAFSIASSKPEWTYQPDPNFDPSTMKYPDVPEQPRSLHAGWRWFVKADGNKFVMDGHHANIFGKYLGSCVFFEFLFNQSSVGNSFVPPGISPEQALDLQKIAHEAITKFQNNPPNSSN